MTDFEYQDRAESALRAVELACDRANETTDVDLDNQRTGGMVTLTFSNRSQIVVNLQNRCMKYGWRLAAAAITSSGTARPGTTPKAAVNCSRC